MSFPRYPQYKPSGVEWLGDVPEGWEVKPLRYNLRLLTEKTDKREHPIALENIEGWTGRFIPTQTDFQGEGIAFAAGDILFGKLRPYLAKAYLAESSGEAVGDFHVMRPTAEVVGRFAQYQILSREFIAIVDGSTFGSKMPRANWEFVSGMKMATPPVSEQTAIAAFLDRETAKIDELVAEQRRLMELLKEKRQAVISHAVTRGLNPQAPLKPSGIEWLGDVPEHWKICLLKRVFRSVDYGISDSLDSEGAVAILRMGNIEDGKIVTDDLKYTGSVDPQLLLGPGDLLYNRTNSLDLIGKVGMFVGNGESPVSFASYLVRLRTVHESLPEYFAYLLNTHGILGLARSNAFVAIGQCNLNPTRYGQIVIAVPPRDEQAVVVNYLDSETAKLDTLTAEAQRAIALLQERRAALISAAVTGQIDVRA